MFVRRKKNRSGSVSVVVCSKERGKFRELQTIGVSSDSEDIKALQRQGHIWIREHSSPGDMLDRQKQIDCEQESGQYFFNSIENILLNGTQLVLERVFRLIGFDQIDDEILKSLVTARICQPMSKTGTIDYLKSHFDEDVEQHQIYRYLDRLEDSQKERIRQISVEHTLRVLGGKIGLVFYDVTTLYFETDYGDELRKAGFSKDGKHSLPQIVLGLPVSAGGDPLAYSIHEGNKYEGHTMLPAVVGFVKQFALKDFVVVADSGLMNEDNVDTLDKTVADILLVLALRQNVRR